MKPILQLPDIHVQPRGEAKGSGPSSAGRRAFKRLQQRSLARANAIKQEHLERISPRKLQDGNGRTASEEEVEALASLLQQRLEHLILDPKGRGWYRLFLFMDDDMSGTISFCELEDTVRVKLKIPQRLFSDEQLQAVWRFLDEEITGFISYGQFGNFMRRGLPANSQRQAERKEALVEDARTRAEETRQARRNWSQEKHAALSDELQRKKKLAAAGHDSLWGFLPQPQKEPWRSPRALPF